MAVTVGVGAPGKHRRPWVVAGLTIVTLGIYAIVWYYKINAEMRDVGAWAGDGALAESRPWRSLAAVTLGAIVIVPSVVSWLATVARLCETERVTTGRRGSGAAPTALLGTGWVLGFGASATNSAALAAVSLCANLGTVMLIQSRLNAALIGGGA